MTTEPTAQPAQTPTVALVTGANKGIGFETARQLVATGWTVWLGARERTRGQQAVDAITAAGHPGEARLLDLDVTQDDSVKRAVGTVGETGLDVLINNAGIPGGFTPVAETIPADFLPVFGVNVLGPVRMIHAFLPLLLHAAHPRIVNVSSGMGSFALTTDPDRFESTLKGLVYPSSKAALNMLTSQYAKALSGVKVNAVDPGYTDTDFNGHRGTQSVQQGTAPVVEVAMLGPDGPTGGFFGTAGPIAW